MRYVTPLDASSLASSFLPELLTQARRRIPTLQRSSPAFFLVPLLVSRSLGHAHQWVAHIYAFATSELPSPPSAVAACSPLPKDETNPHRLVVRYMKEALTKSSCIIGAPRAIEALLELDKVVPVEAKDDSFVRDELDRSRSNQERAEIGMKGISTVYQKDIVGIFNMMDPYLKDIRWFAQNITYGTYLVPHADKTPETSPDPFDQDSTLLSILTLSTIVPQRTPREILWHLQTKVFAGGAIRRGIPREQVRSLHEEIEVVCHACGVDNVREGISTVDDVDKQAEEP
ncbi:BZ3500_MvSof-1268-A1-R1_Chr6-3g08789 [Microbotryum saponariae]|uniref:BZ3500_MvSof-1268-A1-R1_Chr6-3g08789 protein n=1 Tax=Microbotryum saponariae TaxID=289078 RepID=A0A2X0LPJ8_9BASI|nr:BZ3500_MvSof-1268-A1-R1_Chr6-3g08789 [Microbotryum saponariae]SDA07390.1 BZ3501_MvSof-1269-A2-R1_Chr6-2g08492 [Microbotryum saponariae]